jgi:hypothetical protein
LDLLGVLCDTVYYPTVLICGIAVLEEFDGDKSRLVRITIHRSPDNSDKIYVDIRSDAIVELIPSIIQLRIIRHGVIFRQPGLQAVFVLRYNHQLSYLGEMIVPLRRYPATEHEVFDLVLGERVVKIFCSTCRFSPWRYPRLRVRDPFKVTLRSSGS